MIGRNLGPYRIDAVLGKGGMGQVYRASQDSLGRTVAVKTLLPSLAENEEFVERFLREARATARLRHPGIVTIFDVGEQDGVYFFAMEYLEGRTLDRIVREEGPLATEAAARFVVQIAHALAHAHSRGILHRDVKPANILVGDDGRAVLTDFGIARAASETRLTRTGTAIGSPDYMSPEQVLGQSLDHRSDLYALGVIFYELLTGKVPYQGDSAVSVAFQHVNEAVRSPRETNPAVPVAIDRVAQRLMAKAPEERYESAGDVVESLEAAMTGVVPEAVSVTQRAISLPGTATGGGHGVKLVAAALGVVAVGLAITAVLYFGSPSAPGPRGGGGGPPPPGGTTDPSGSTSAAGGSSDSETDSGPGDTGIDASPAGDSAAQDAVTVGGDAAAQVSAATDGPVAEPAPVAYRIRTNPAGATVTLDGEPLGGVTPVSVDLVSERRYDLRLALDGHEPTTFAFSLDDLTEAQRESAELFFPLTSATPPGRVLVQSGYPVRVEVGGRSWDARQGTVLELPPGTHQVRLRAPDVFYTDTRTVTVASDAQVPLVLPPAAEITVAATPSYCRVSIDGIDVGYLPATVRITVGNHELHFDWERLGRTLDVTRSVRLDTGRIFVAAPDGEPG